MRDKWKKGNCTEVLGFVFFSLFVKILVLKKSTLVCVDDSKTNEKPTSKFGYKNDPSLKPLTLRPQLCFSFLFKMF